MQVQRAMTMEPVELAMVAASRATAQPSPANATANGTTSRAVTGVTGVGATGTGVSGTGVSGTGTGQSADAKEAQEVRAPANLANLTAGDRAAVASATGFYVSATGEVTPEGLPPWQFIIQYVQQRQVERAEPKAEPAVEPVGKVQLSDDGPHVDVMA